MSSLSLRDQLLQAGLVNEQQVKEAERQAQRRQYQGQKHQPREQRNGPTAAEIAAKKHAEAKAARDQELNRKQQEKAQRKALYAQIRELVSENRITRPDVEETYNFIDGGKVRRIRADAALRERITRGEVMLVRCEGRGRGLQGFRGARRSDVVSDRMLNRPCRSVSQRLSWMPPGRTSAA